jgi:photosystem II stability/assembly factor-like uncharacterized protein
MGPIIFRKRLCAALGAALLLSGCLVAGGSGRGKKEAREPVVSLRVGVGGVNGLGKSQVIRLRKLRIVISSSAGDTLRDSMTALTSPALDSVSTAAQILAKNYPLGALRSWKIMATSRDALDSVIHRDSAVIPVLYAGDTVAVNLGLSARYSMYEARFLDIPDSIRSGPGDLKQALCINRLVLKIDGAVVRDSLSPGPCFDDTTHALAYDYLPSGSAWVAKASGTTRDLYSVQVLPSDKGYVVGDSVTVRTDDDGDSWYGWSAAPLIARSAFFVDSLTAYVVYDSGFLVSTQDGGDGGMVLSSGTTENLLAVYFTTSALGYVAGTNGTLIKTTDSGSTWTAQASGTTENLNALYFANASLGYAAGNGGVLLKTVDGGATWVPQTSGTTENLNVLHFFGASTGFAAGDGGVLLKPVNGGSTWIPQTSGTTENLNSMGFFDATTGWIVGGNGVILKTGNGGGAWAPEVSGTTQNLRFVHFAGSRGYIVGDGGTILIISGLHTVEMLAYGELFNWDEALPLYSGSTPIHVEAGSDAIIPLTLQWTGPTTGVGSLSATIGKVGKVTVNGTVPGTVSP